MQAKGGASTLQDAPKDNNSGGNAKHSVPQWLGANCKVLMNTISFLWYIAFIYILQELSQNSACPTPTIIMDK